MKSGSMISYFLMYNLTVIDNASYHSRRIERVPTTSSRKSEMQDWLVAHNIEFPECALKQELLSLIRLSNPQPKYVIDELAKTSGHDSGDLRTGSKLLLHLT